MSICNNLKASFFTLGCKLNFSETSTIGKMLAERGIARAIEGEKPDICVINTCSVTETADKKGRQLIRRLTKLYPEATIVVTGCYAQLKPQQIAEIPGVDIILGSNEKLRIADYLDRWLEEQQQLNVTTPMLEIKEFMPSCERGDRTRYFLKVQDGCDYFCTYCTIPFARGRSRSGKISEIVEMAKKAASEGGKEIVVTGVNTGEFGRDTGESFLELLKRLDEIESVKRFRISSIEPNLLTDEIINWVATQSRAFMPHFHIPLQSGSDAVLRLMNRRYDTTLFAEKLQAVRQALPDAFIGVDVIAGARGETMQEWKKSLEFISSLPLTRLHVFPYSERPGTKALLLGDNVPIEERHRRVSMLTEVSNRKLHDFMTSNIGLTRRVLWEAGHREDLMHGLTDNYLRVTATRNDSLINTVTPVHLTGFGENLETLTGEIVN